MINQPVYRLQENDDYNAHYSTPGHIGADRKKIKGIKTRNTSIASDSESSAKVI